MSAQIQRIGSLRSASMKSPARAQSTRTEMVALKPGSLVLRVLVLLACAASAVPALASDALWKRIGQGGVAVMIRHAQTVPGIGDPPAFRIGDCSTQRNLSAEGRAQAARLGAAFKARGIRPARVLSSQWCRCIDTATAAFGRHTEESALNSFFEGRGTEPAQSAAVKRLIAGVKPGELLVLVTHQVNITALTGESVAQGEMFVVTLAANDAVALIGRIPAPEVRPDKQP